MANKVIPQKVLNQSCWYCNRHGRFHTAWEATEKENEYKCAVCGARITI